MRLLEVFPAHEKNIGLNFAKLYQDNETLRKLGFINLKGRVDLTKKSFENKMYDIISPYVNTDSTVFMIPPDHVITLPLIYNTLVSLSSKLPYTVYFNPGKDPNLQDPLVYSGEGLRQRIYEARELKIPLGSF